MTAIGVMIMHFVEGWRILDTEGTVSVLTMQAFLVSINHGLPVEAARILD